LRGNRPAGYALILKGGHSMQTIDEAVKELYEAVNSKNIEAVLDFYEDEALLVIQPGRLARGKL